jgi:hypothetical protein
MLREGFDLGLHGQLWKLCTSLRANQTDEYGV